MKADLKILISRFLTRSGDQAWSFAVPIVLIQVLSLHPRAVFSYFFLTFLGGFLLMPYLGRMIDRTSRKNAFRAGIGAQLAGVILAFVAVSLINGHVKGSGQELDSMLFAMFAGLLIASLLANLGSSMTDISVANDLAPTLIPAEGLTRFNSRLRQLDLFTEVASPVAAGLLLMLFGEANILAGFGLIAFWNIVSFVPEYLLIRSVLNQDPQLLEKRIDTTTQKKSLRENLAAGWPEFISQPIAVAMICYSMLWLSVLSPHGVLLTAFLKNGWDLPEAMIGSFRGLGAVFGLVATLLFPWIVTRYGLIGGSRLFIRFQALTVAIAGILFFIPHSAAKIGFLAFILLSRIGLYGYSLGEGQMRQIYIPEKSRGVVNGAATALNSLATLLLLGLGTIFSSPENFYALVLLSCSVVILASWGISIWKPFNLESDSRMK